MYNVLMNGTGTVSVNIRMGIRADMMIKTATATSM
jgi:hypothetical protein